jgi:DNA-directed RNA polymerase subunit RPC12/RpoP
MIDRIYISYAENDEPLSQELAQALWAVNLESSSSMYSKVLHVSRGQRICYGISHSDCIIIMLTREGALSPRVNQEIGLTVAGNNLIIVLAEKGVELPVLVEHLVPIVFTQDTFTDALGYLIYTLRSLTKFEWLRIKCPYCKEEMTQYITPQEEVDRSLLAGTQLNTMCNYCESKLFLDPRTFRPVL